MAQSYSTPGVYVQELNAFPNSVVEVATAIPAFIGYTARVLSPGGKNLEYVPTEVTSLKEFEDFFGTGFTQTFSLATSKPSPESLPLFLNFAPLSLSAAPTTSYYLQPDADNGLFYLYNAIRLFFSNGGSTCYIVSLGNYAAATAATTVTQFTDAIATLELEQDPTMLLCPDAFRLSSEDYNMVMGAMLSHCNKVQNRVALFDVYGGAQPDLDHPDPTSEGAAIDAFRTGVGQNYLNYGIAYFPWVNASIVASTEVSFLNLDTDALTTTLQPLLNPTSTTTPVWNQVQVLNWPNDQLTEIFTQAATMAGYAKDPTTIPTITPASGQPALTPQAVASLFKQAVTSLDNALQASFPDYKTLLKAINTYLNTLPVAPAMAGVFTAVDNNVGVWKAPANVSLNAVVSPTVAVNDFIQQDMNVDAATGKSVNAIRTFRGMGVLVWGARTLDGNSQDWRYINVRRTMIMIEQSVKLAARAYVFAPNDANTWATVKSMITSFLFNLWKQGALQGAVATDAFSVSIGLGSTMTADDLLNGLMNVTVLVAVVHPAEFIVLTFQQQMAKS